MNNPTSLNAALISGLTKLAQHFVNKMNQKISQNGLPKEISDSVEIEPAEVLGDGSARIRIKVGGNKAPMATAFEYGSGIHGGDFNTYPIMPKNAKYLSFPRSRWPNYQPPPDRERFFFTFVNHPGVAPRPYIHPTLIEEKAEIERILTQKVIASIHIGGSTKATV